MVLSISVACFDDAYRLVNDEIIRVRYGDDGVLIYRQYLFFQSPLQRH